MAVLKASLTAQAFLSGDFRWVSKQERGGEGGTNLLEFSTQFEGMR